MELQLIVDWYLIANLTIGSLMIPLMLLESSTINIHPNFPKELEEDWVVNT